MAQTNATILGAMGLINTDDYAQHAIEPGKPDLVAQTMQDISGDARLKNEFYDQLFTLIGKQIVYNRFWINPFGVFKDDAYKNGKKVQEINAMLIDSYRYNPTVNNFFERHELDIKQAVYEINRRVVYPFTFNRDQLFQSFISGDGYELNEFLNLVLSTVTVSNQYDEYISTLQAFKVTNAKFPFYNKTVKIVNSDNPTEEELKNLSLSLRNVASDMAVAPTGQYNGLGVQITSEKSDLILITTPGIKNAMDVNVLADAFNTDKVEILNRIVEVKELPWKDVHAILVDRKGFVLGDFINDIETIYNPRSRETTGYLHAQGGFNISAMNNVCLFSNADTTQIGVVTVELTGIEASLEKDGVAVTKVKPGKEKAQLVVSSTGTVTGDETDKVIVPSNYIVEITSTGEITPSTFVDSNGYLHIGSSVEVGDNLTLTVKSAYLNPSAEVGSDTVEFSYVVEVEVDKTFA